MATCARTKLRGTQVWPNVACAKQRRPKETSAVQLLRMNAGSKTLAASANKPENYRAAKLPTQEAQANTIKHQPASQPASQPTNQRPTELTKQTSIQKANKTDMRMAQAMGAFAFIPFPVPKLQLGLFRCRCGLIRWSRQRGHEPGQTMTETASQCQRHHN